MKTEYIVIGGVLMAVFIFSSFSSNNGSLDLTVFDDVKGSDDVERLNKVYRQLSNRGLSDEQILFCLAQILVETGLFTDSPNYIAVDQRLNYAGITRNGQYEWYNSVSDFVDDYLAIISKNNDPLDATDITDFNNRLKANGYYTDSKTTYGNNLKYYYNYLQSAIK